jgi:hypothetical protein
MKHCSPHHSVRPEPVEGLYFFSLRPKEVKGFDNDGAPIALSGGQRSPIISPNGWEG